VIELLLGLCATSNAALILVTHNAAHAAKTRRSVLLTQGRLGPAVTS
jgi:predicted ABC-type transport system involved in lysophospholipase L1 biosynthesis ATPase subunit